MKSVALAVPKIFHGVRNSKIGHVTLITPLSERFIAGRLGHAMINLTNKFEVPVFTRYGNMEGVAKCRKWGGLEVVRGHPGPLKIAPFVRAHMSSY